MNDKIMTIKEFLAWEFEFFQQRRAAFLRLGQAFINDHKIIGNEILFYEPDDMKARAIIYETYLSEE